MKKNRRMPCIALMISWAVIGLTNESSAVFIDRTSAVAATATRPITPGALLDNFNGGLTTNAWGGTTGTFVQQGSAATCTANYPSSPDPVTGIAGKCLQLIYNVNQSASYAGYFTSFGGGGINTYTNLSFYVKGSVSNLFFKIELKNNSTTQYWSASESTNYYRSKSVIYNKDYLVQGVTTTWQKVTIPLRNFANLDGLASMNELVFVFENSQSTINGSPTQGTLYIDNIMFDANAVNTVSIDHFNDKIGVNSMGGNVGTFGGAGGSITSQTYTGLWIRINYNVNVGYAGSTFIFGGGNDAVELPGKSGWIAIPSNFSDFNQAATSGISLWVWSDTPATTPKVMKVEIISNAGTSYYVINGISTSGQLFKILFSNFTGAAVDKATIRQVNFVFEDWRIAAAGGNKIGDVVVEGMQFEK